MKQSHRSRCFASLLVLAAFAAGVRSQQVERLVGSTWVDDTNNQTIVVQANDFGEGVFGSTEYFVWERQNTIYRCRKSNVEAVFKNKLQKAVDKNGEAVLTTKNGGRLDDGAAR